VVLLITQALNLVLVPYLAHAGLALAIGLGALVNALWLLLGLIRRGSYVPQSGWLRFGAQVGLASALLAAGLAAAAQQVAWVDLQSQPGLRAGLMAAAVIVGAVLYLATLRLLGFPLKSLIGR